MDIESSSSVKGMHAPTQYLQLSERKISACEGYLFKIAAPPSEYGFYVYLYSEMGI